MLSKEEEALPPVCLISREYISETPSPPSLNPPYPLFGRERHLPLNREIPRRGRVLLLLDSLFSPLFLFFTYPWQIILRVYTLPFEVQVAG